MRNPAIVFAVFLSACLLLDVLVAMTLISVMVGYALKLEAAPPPVQQVQLTAHDATGRIMQATATTNALVYTSNYVLQLDYTTPDIFCNAFGKQSP